MKPPSDHTGGQLSSTDSESQLISVILEGHSDWLPALLRVIPDAEAFTTPHRQVMWRTIIDMQNANKAISYDTITVELRRVGVVSDPDSFVLSQYSTHAVLNENLAIWHAQQIAFAHARRLHAETTQIIHIADASPEQLAVDLRQKLSSIERIAAITGGELPTPRPLVGSLPQVQTFNPLWLPSSLRPWISDISERMQCPPDFPAVAAMSALSSVAGRRFCIQPKERDESWFEFPTLWAMLIGRPSLMKSPSMQAAMRPLRTLEKEAFASNEISQRDRQALRIKNSFERKALEAKAKTAAKDGSEFDYASLIDQDEDDDEVPRRRLIVNDASIEALGEVLRDNPTGTLLYQDELVGLLAMLEKDGNQSLRAFLLQAWSGKESFTFDRITRGIRRVEHCALTVLGSIQPGVLLAQVRAANADGAGADGFMQRFSLMVWPDMPNPWKNIDRPLDEKAEAEASAVFTAIENLIPADLFRMGAKEGRDEVPTFCFAPDAQAIFDEWRYQFENRIRSETIHQSIEAHLGKYRKLVPALAVLIHVAEWQAGPVSLSALERSLRWAAYLETHANRVYSAGNAASIEPAKALLRKLLENPSLLPDDFTARQVYRKGWAGLNRSEDAEAACEMLVDHGWLIVTPQPTTDKGGCPTFRYHINPAAKNSENRPG